MPRVWHHRETSSGSIRDEADGIRIAPVHVGSKDTWQRHEVERRVGRVGRGPRGDEDAVPVGRSIE